MNDRIMSPVIKNAGYCVFAPNYGKYPGAPYPISLIGAVGGLERSTRELADFTDRVLAATGASKVSFVGHSQGTLIPALYLKSGGGAGKVTAAVAVGPALAGSPVPFRDSLDTAGIPESVLDLPNAFCQGCFDTDPSGPLMKAFHDGGPYVPGTHYTNIASRYDPLGPPALSLIPGDDVSNIVVQDLCPNDLSEHASMFVSPVVATLILNALDPAHPQPVRCVR